MQWWVDSLIEGNKVTAALEAAVGLQHTLHIQIHAYMHTYILSLALDMSDEVLGD